MEPTSSCEGIKDAAIKSNPFILFMLKAMNELGCDTSLEARLFEIQCVPCNNEAQIGHFNSSSRPKSITLCSDNIDKFHLSTSHVERTILHELIHAYDYCRATVDENNCEHIACTEIRAAHLSGDCDLKNEIQRRNFAIKGQGSACARRRAELSVSMHPHCAQKAKEAVNNVFDTCYSDTSPFLGKF